ncbi:hypothetical protein [Oleidesulfovibrio sp.]|uniref:hypothetical protein n=1 Tax=Oleidesulfovibrio sp. TaxID=2909707 RepID=UPI003A86D177
MKPEEFAQRFFDTAAEMGCSLTEKGNIICKGGKNLSRGKVARMWQRYGELCMSDAKKEFKNDTHGLKQFRQIAERTLQA